MPVAITRIVLLTGEAEAPALSSELLIHNPTLDTIVAHNHQELARAAQKFDGGTRLLSFCTSVIVPREMLEALPGPAYNFHPGPPERPGRYPSVFALYDRAPHFGLTVHEMAPTVDSGPIVNAEWFDIPEGCDLIELESRTLIRLVNVFRKLAPYLALFSLPLPRQDIQWQGRKTAKTDCDDLCRITPDMNPEEIRRRQLACGMHLTKI
jgi:methionyl-tRNA formyltransferase